MLGKDSSSATASPWLHFHIAAESICRNPKASLFPHIKQQCLPGHCVGPEAARLLTAALLILAQLLVPDESKAWCSP